jgi:quinol-cytochrome oxidoreductase complex cytochrome b subunit
VRSAHFRPVYKWVFWLLLLDVIMLGWVGAHRPDLPAFHIFGHPITYISIGQIGTLYYFFHFLVLFPLIGWFERPLPLPTSIGTAVTPKGGGRLAGAARPMEKP